MRPFPFLLCASAVWLPLLTPHVALAQTTSPAPAGGLSVAPVHLALTDTRRSASTMVSNPGGVPLTVQVRLYRWSMNGEEEVYEPATDAGFSPPIFRLEPHTVQAVRIVAKVAAGPVERSYRLVVDQLPANDAPGQLQLPVRMVLPVFVEPMAGVSRAPSLAWTAHYDPRAERIVIKVVNNGTVHVKFVDLAVHDGDKSLPIAPGLAGYALAGGSREWSYKASGVSESMTITANGGPASVRVTIPVTRQ